jgi:hypothetical protein
MTWLEIPDPLDPYVIGAALHVRLPVEGETDAQWRRIYNNLAAAEGVPVEALGNEDRTVLIVALPLDSSPDFIPVIFWKVADLLPKVDDARKAELNRLRYGPEVTAVREWCLDYEHLRRYGTARTKASPF